MAASSAGYGQFTTTYVIDTPSDNTVTFRLAEAGGGLVFFAAGIASTRLEPCITRGTYGTTQLLADIYPGTTGSDPDEFTKVGNYMYFAATDPTNGRELWRTNLTTLATTLVKNLRPGSGSSNPHHLAECNGKLVFSCEADPTNIGDELYVSDGTDAGTVLLADIIPGNGDANIQRISTQAGVTYFSANAGVGFGNHLFRTDGTAAGTYKLYDGRTSCYPQMFFRYDGTTYFFMQDGASGSGFALWRTDGTLGGTVMIKSPITDASGNGGATAPDSVAIANGLFFFRGGTHATGYELWRSDGTEAGTYMVKDIDTGTNYGFPEYLVAYQNKVYFIADDATYGKQLWRSDGTEAGTEIVHEIYNASAFNPPDPRRLAVIGNKLLFLVNRDGYGLEWWATDGTPGGLTLAADIRPGTGNGVRDAYPNNVSFVSGNTLYFNGDTVATSIELFALTAYVPPVKSQMLTPAPGSTLASTTQTFTWDTGTGVTSYALWIGSAPGGYDIYAGNEGVNLSKTMSTLPDDGRTIYVTLFSLINGVNQSNSYTYTCFRGPQPRKARITSPANGSTLASSSLPLVWDSGLSVTNYILYVGTYQGGYNLYAGNEGTSTSRTITVQPGSGRVYVTLWSLIRGAYQANYYYFEAQPAVKAALATPAQGSTISGNTLNMTWTAGTGVSKYLVWIGSTYGGYDLGAYDAGTSTSRSMTIPQDGGPVYVTLWSIINGGYQSNNYWFMASLPASGNRPGRITSHANTMTLSSTSLPLVWDAGSGVSSFALWVGSKPDGYDIYAGAEGSNTSKTVIVPGDGRRIYVTLHSLIGGAYQSNSYYYTCATLPGGGAAQMTSPANGSTLAGTSLPLVWGTAPGATSYLLWVGSSPMGYDIYAGAEGSNTSKTVTVNTNGCPVYVTLWSLINGQYLSNSYYYTRASSGGGSRPCWITSPANGTTLSSGATNFTWDAGSGVTSGALWIGSSPGAYDLLAAAAATNSNRSVTLPSDGRKIYVTLWSVIGGVYQSSSYLYTAANEAASKGTITSPANGSALPGASATFTWSAGSGASSYALYIGRTPGGYNVYAGAEGTNTSKTVTTLPLDGGPVYVTLWSLVNGAWLSSESIYSAASP